MILTSNFEVDLDVRRIVSSLKPACLHVALADSKPRQPTSPSSSAFLRAAEINWGLSHMTEVLNGINDWLDKTFPREKRENWSASVGPCHNLPGK